MKTDLEALEREVRELLTEHSLEETVGADPKERQVLNRLVVWLRWWLLMGSFDWVRWIRDQRKREERRAEREGVIQGVLEDSEGWEIGALFEVTIPR